jgi:2-oxoisovalerate dehydrogenase E1 component
LALMFEPMLHRSARPPAVFAGLLTGYRTARMKMIESIEPLNLAAEPEIWLSLYTRMQLIRQFELAAQREYKAGRMPGFIHLYVGEEAVAAGVCAHLGEKDWITSTHRGHGHALAKGVSPQALMAELYGKKTGCCGGRGGSMHLYDAAAGLFGTNGFVGAGIPAATGAGLSAKVRGTKHVGVTFFGDGAVNHGAFHESINFAAVQNLPVIFVCENNLYATATPLAMATKNCDIASRAAGYGLPGIAVDGNDVMAVWEATRQAVSLARSGGGPTLIEARTYRIVGHHEGDPLVGTYRTQEELDEWKQKCPIARFKRFLLERQIANADNLETIDQEAALQVKEAVAFAESSPLPDADTAELHVWGTPFEPPVPPRNSPSATERTWLDAVRDGIAEEMRNDRNLIYLGEGIGERGGSFAHTKGLWKEFGAGRVIDTPISELGFTGAAIGAAATGCRAVADLMFADFLFEAASQIIEQAGKLRYMSNGQMAVPLAIRAGMGAIKNAGPHHSGCYYPVWAHCPGLVVAVPSNPADAKGLIKTALRSSDPVIFLEHKLLFGSRGVVPSGDHCVPFGRASVVRKGKDLTVITCGELVHRSLQAASRLEEAGVSCEVIDLRTIVPLDVDTICESISRTGRLLVVDEAFSMCGMGAEIAAVVMEEAFDDLDAPVGRLHTAPVAQPFSPSLENAVMVTAEKIVAAAKSLIAGSPPRRRRRHRTSVSVAALPRTATAEAESKDSSPSPVISATGIPIMLPNQDLTVTEATIVRWLKKIGDDLRAGEEIVEVETAKSTFPVEAPARGILRGIHAPEGSVVRMDQPLGELEAT